MTALRCAHHDGAQPHRGGDLLARLDGRTVTAGRRVEVFHATGPITRGGTSDLTDGGVDVRCPRCRRWVALAAEPFGPGAPLAPGVWAQARGMDYA